MAQPLSKTDSATNKMNNEKLIEKVLKKIEKEEKGFWNGNIPTIVKKAISLTIAKKDAQKDLFVKKLKYPKEDMILTVGSFHKEIDKLNKEVFGDE